MFVVNNQKIGKGYKPFIIAELSANHGGDIDRAKEVKTDNWAIFTHDFLLIDE